MKTKKRIEYIIKMVTKKHEKEHERKNLNQGAQELHGEYLDGFDDQSTAEIAFLRCRGPISAVTKRSLCQDISPFVPLLTTSSFLQRLHRNLRLIASLLSVTSIVF